MPDASPSEGQTRTLAPVITWRTTLVTSVDCSTCKLVGLVLSLYMNERGGSAFPSVPTLAHDCSLSERSVRQHLNEHLHAQGWLTLIERGGLAGKARRANEWQASTPAGNAGVPDEPRQDVPQPRHLSALTPADGAAQVVQERVHEVVGLKCPNPICDLTFSSIDERDEHYADCSDPDLTPASEIPTRREAANG